MSRLGELIKELCPNGVDYKKIDEILKTVSAPRKLMRKEYQSIGKFPIVDQGQEFIVGYTDDIDAILEEKEYIILGEHTRIIKYVNFEFAQGADGLKILISKHKDDVKYLYHAFSNLEIPSRGYNRHWTIAKELKIPLPPIEVQREIVRILDNFTELTAELTAELKKRKSQYEFYRDELFYFNKFIPILKLREFATITRGGNLQKKDFLDSGIPCIHYGEIYTKYGMSAEETFQFVSKEVASKSRQAKRNDIVMAVTSENIEDVGKCLAWIGEENVAVSGHIAIISHNINAKYLSYYFHTHHFYKQKVKLAYGTKVIEITPSKLNSIEVPVPSLEEQERIVSILDKFDALVNDISIGLPAEIEARKKQYEYYRDKLLNFKDVDASEIL